MHSSSPWPCRKSSPRIRLDVFNEIRSVFSEPMNNDPAFLFDMLQLTGTGTKTLGVPALSSSFRWTPKEVAGRADSTIS